MFDRQVNPAGRDRAPDRRQDPATVDDRATPGHQRDLIDLLAVQRLAGNRAATALVAGHRGDTGGRNGSVVQRDLNDEQRAQWDSSRGPDAVSRARQVADDWRGYRGAPGSFSKLPASQPLLQVVEAVDALDPALRRYAAEKIGGDAIKYLSEMTGFVPEVRRLIGLLPGVAYVDPQHNYVMTTDASGKVGPVEIPVSILAVEYSNAYGWHWRKELLGSSLKWPVGITKPAGGKASGGVKPIPEIAAIAIQTKAQAKSGAYYWGYEDLAGPVLVVNGPSIKVTGRGVGAKASTGGIITLTGSGSGPPTKLDFMNIDLTTKFSPINAGKVDNWTKDGSPVGKGPEFNLTLVEGGAGALVGLGAQVATPELAPQPVPDERQWRYVLGGFETGRADMPIPEGEVHPILQMIASDLTDKRQSVESIKPYLAEAGIAQEWRLTFVCEGYASRRWAGARTDADRQAKNLELSTSRAQNVASALYERFGPDHKYDASGRGAAVFIVDSDAPYQQASVAPESDPEAVERLVSRREAELRARARAGLIPDDQIEQMLAEFRAGLQRVNAKDSDVLMARRVNITVLWRGYTIQWGANASPAPHAAP